MNTHISEKNKTYFIPLGKKLINARVLFTFVICAVLIIIGTIRILSYSRDGFISEMTRGTLFHHFAYRPESYINVNFYKILATPSITALIYFLFRGLNNFGGRIKMNKINHDWTRINFDRPFFRLFLVTIITLCWIPVEVVKFNFRNAFYPYSELEDPFVNFAVLTAGGIMSFFLMKHLTFEPLITLKN